MGYKVKILKRFSGQYEGNQVPGKHGRDNFLENISRERAHYLAGLGLVEIVSGEETDKAAAEVHGNRETKVVNLPPGGRDGEKDWNLKTGAKPSSSSQPDPAPENTTLPKSEDGQPLPSTTDSDSTQAPTSSTPATETGGDTTSDTSANASPANSGPATTKPQKNSASKKSSAKSPQGSASNQAGSEAAEE